MRPSQLIHQKFEYGGSPVIHICVMKSLTLKVFPTQFNRRQSPPSTSQHSIAMSTSIKNRWTTIKRVKGDSDGEYTTSPATNNVFHKRTGRPSERATNH
jgi:hypothetical protein